MSSIQCPLSNVHCRGGRQFGKKVCSPYFGHFGAKKFLFLTLSTRKFARKICFVFFLYNFIICWSFSGNFRQFWANSSIFDQFSRELRFVWVWLGSTANIRYSPSCRLPHRQPGCKSCRGRSAQVCWVCPNLVHCPLVKCKMSTVKCSVSTVKCPVSSIHSNVQCPLSTVHCPLSTVKCPVSSIHSNVLCPVSNVPLRILCPVSNFRLIIVINV